MARGPASNPRAKFLHISYSDDLALLNSQTAKELVQSDEFQELRPLKVAADAKSKKRQTDAAHFVTSATGRAYF
ncbi:hypothetical protein LMG1861_05101 [Achromobacter piechaudii]|uniref:Uncharacterized protein n=1 Tax=Achromobacter piechaudii TaxID=72556 RepID=A0A6S7ENE8_9BURK|nr:hypothetical protein LMG1861_05101 [Achromobacter piechaudii]